MVSQSHTTTLLLLFTTFLFISRSISAVHLPPRLNATTNDLNFIRTSCNATEYPDVCFKSLAAYASFVQKSPARLAKLATVVSLSEARSTVAFLSNLSRSDDDVKFCVGRVRDAINEIRDSLGQLRDINRTARVKASPRLPLEKFRSLMSDVQSFMSAARTYEEDCTDAFDEDYRTDEIKTTVFDRLQGLKSFTSIALALVNTYADNRSPP